MSGDRFPVSREAYGDFIEQCCLNMPEGFAGTEPVEEVIVRYIRLLEALRESRRAPSVRQVIGTVEAGSRVVGMFIDQTPGSERRRPR